MKPYKRIASYLAAGMLAFAPGCQDPGQDREPVKHEQRHDVKKEEQRFYAPYNSPDEPNRARAQENLKSIVKSLETRGRKSIKLDIANLGIVVALNLEDIDNDGKKDYVLRIGWEGMSENALEPPMLYIEDRSHNGNGSVDSFILYKHIGGKSYSGMPVNVDDLEERTNDFVRQTGEYSKDNPDLDENARELRKETAGCMLAAEWYYTALEAIARVLEKKDQIDFDKSI